jgi:hypothetical protein
VALDGSGRNSPFTAALLHHIDSEGESISDVARSRLALDRFNWLASLELPLD